MGNENKFKWNGIHFMFSSRRLVYNKGVKTKYEKVSILSKIGIKI